LLDLLIFFARASNSINELNLSSQIQFDLAGVISIINIINYFDADLSCWAG